MTLIKCPDCGQEISELARACPNCGRPASLQDPSPGAQNSRPLGSSVDLPLSLADFSDPSARDRPTSPLLGYFTDNVTTLATIGFLGLVLLLAVVFAVVDWGKAEHLGATRAEYTPNFWAPQDLELFRQMDRSQPLGRSLPPCSEFQGVELGVENGKSWVSVTKSDGPRGFALVGDLQRYPGEGLAGLSFISLRDRLRSMTQIQRAEALETHLPGKCVRWQGWIDSVTEIGPDAGFRVLLDMDAPDVFLSTWDVELVIWLRDWALLLDRDQPVWVDGVIKSAQYSLGLRVVLEHGFVY